MWEATESDCVWFSTLNVFEKVRKRLNVWISVFRYVKNKTFKNLGKPKKKRLLGFLFFCPFGTWSSLMTIVIAPCLRKTLCNASTTIWWFFTFCWNIFPNSLTLFYFLMWNVFRFFFFNQWLSNSSHTSHIWL